MNLGLQAVFIEMPYRTFKQLIIIAIYLLILAGIGTGLYFHYRAEPTCFDGKKNQGEEEVDCGGPCPPCEIRYLRKPEILWADFFATGEHSGDVAVKIKNSNSRYGARKFSYKMVLLDAFGEELAARVGESFVMPQELKYLVEPKFDVVAGEVKDVQIEIFDIQWAALSDYQPDLSARGVRARFSVPPEIGYLEVSGLVMNRGAILLDRVGVNAILYDKDRRPIAAGRTEIRSLKPNGERYFKILWPKPFPGVSDENIDFTNIEVVPEANFFLYY